MPISTRYLFTASMDVDPDKEALFDEVYDQEHVPNLLKVPGVISVTRLTLEPLTLGIGGECAALPWPAPAWRFRSPAGTKDGSPGRQPGVPESFVKSLAPAGAKENPVHRLSNATRVWSQFCRPCRGFLV